MINSLIRTHQDLSKYGKLILIFSSRAVSRRIGCQTWSPTIQRSFDKGPRVFNGIYWDLLGKIYSKNTDFNVI